MSKVIEVRFDVIVEDDFVEEFEKIVNYKLLDAFHNLSEFPEINSVCYASTKLIGNDNSKDISTKNIVEEDSEYMNYKCRATGDVVNTFTSNLGSLKCIARMRFIYLDTYFKTVEDKQKFNNDLLHSIVYRWEYLLKKYGVTTFYNYEDVSNFIMYGGKDLDYVEFQKLILETVPKCMTYKIDNSRVFVKYNFEFNCVGANCFVGALDRSKVIHDLRSNK